MALRQSVVLFATAAVLVSAFPLVATGSAPTELTWSGTWNTNFRTMILKQSGGSVQGTYEYDDGRGFDQHGPCGRR